MPRQKIEGLISQLHERLTSTKTSPEQELMIAQMKSQLDDWEGPEPADGDLRELAETLLDDVEEHHPKATEIIREIIETLRHVGL